MFLPAFFLVPLSIIVALLCVLSVKPASAQIELTLGQPFSGELTHAGDVNYYSVDVEAGEHLFVFVDKAAVWDGTLRIAFGHLPSPGDASASSINAADQVVELPQTEAGTYYVQVSSYYNGFGSYVITAMSDDTLPALTLGVALSDELKERSDVNYYRVDVAAGEHLFVFLDKPQQWYAYLRIRYGQLPDGQQSDASSYSGHG